MSTAGMLFHSMEDKKTQIYMKLKLSLTFLLLMCYLSCYSKTTEREPVGNLTVYQAKQASTARFFGLVPKAKRYSEWDIHYKKDELVGALELEKTKSGNYKEYACYEIIDDVNGYHIFPKNAIYSKKYQFHELLLSDIGNGLEFISKDGKIKAEIFKHNLNGHKILTYSKESDEDSQPTDYMFCLEDIIVGTTYCSILHVNGDHVNLYDDEFPENKKYGGYVKTCYNPNSINYYFDKNGNMLCDVMAVNDCYLPNDNEYICSLTIAYLHDRKELYIDGGRFMGNYFLKLQNKK